MTTNAQPSSSRGLLRLPTVNNWLPALLLFGISACDANPQETPTKAPEAPAKTQEAPTKADATPVKAQARPTKVEGQPTNLQAPPTKAQAQPTRVAGAHRYFNGGFGTYQAASGEVVGPRYTKGHTWITKKAIDFLKERGLLPKQMQSEDNQKYLYYGTSFADWQWLGRPESPETPVPSPVTANLNAYDSLRNTSPNCPYAPSCPVPELIASSPYTYDNLPNLTHIKNPPGMAGGNCTDQYSSLKVPGWTFSDDDTGKGTYGDLTQTNTSCLKPSPIANFEDKNIERHTEATITLQADLYMKASAAYGLSNGLKTYMSGDIEPPAYPWAYTGYPWTFLEDKLEFHTNPVMIFKPTVLIGGGDTWLDWLSSSAALTWGNPIAPNNALDNLYHYSLSDISLYSGLGKTPADPKSTDAAVAACSQYLAGRVYYDNDAYDACYGACMAACCTGTIGFCFLTNCGCDDACSSVRDSAPGWEDDNKWSSYEACLATVSPLPTSVVLYPLYYNDYVSVSSTAKDHPMLLKDALLQLQYQPVYGKVSYGAPRYGSVLYQLARKFFQGSPATPSLNELIRAGNDVPTDSEGHNWRTGGMYGTKSIYGGADFSPVTLDFPHTYLGGNPFICSGGTKVTDTCADGSPTWPTWLPDTYDANDPATFLAKLSDAAPGQSDRAALIYLGWAAHLMQDLALPHHAANWSSAQHAFQDSIGDYFAVADVEQNSPDLYPVGDTDADAIKAELARNDVPFLGTPPDIKTLLDAFYAQIETDLDAKLAPFSGSVAQYCNSVNLSRDSVISGRLDWPSVLPAFLAQGEKAAAARQSMWANVSRFDIETGYSTAIMKNAIEKTVDLLLCATPACAPNCGHGEWCASDGECASGVCANGSCACPHGYSGDDCSVTCPGGPTCSGHGLCLNGSCLCIPAIWYSGPDCSVTCPGGPTCSGHGLCANKTCTCVPGSGYSGPDCSVTCPGGPSCSGHGTCSNGACSCTPGSGYSGPDCSVTCPGGPTCSGHGTCSNGACSCTPGSGYSGPDCGVTCPGGPLCSGQGTCVNGTCFCADGYSGPDCSVTCPGGPTCSGHGTCSNGTCSCTAGNGYSGPDCSVTCPGGPTCSDHGTCSNGTCTCTAGNGYSGPDCSVTCPGGPTCSGHGTCSNGTCTCTPGNGYSGPDCSVTCPGGPTCSNHGTCLNATCSCARGYTGASCSVNCTIGSICPDGTGCNVNADCASRVCGANHICQAPGCAPHCNQGAACGANGDCGSGVCTSGLCHAPACTPLCSPNAACGVNGDCASRVCVNNLCQAPGCSPHCNQGASCGANGDCSSRVCTAGLCQVPACSPHCSKGAACGTNNDCTSRVCNNGTCR
jgi:hypothetical protein